MNCPKCGKEIADTQKFCPECGANTAAPTNALLEELSKKVKLEAYIWLGIAAFQVLFGLYRIIFGGFVYGLLMFVLAFLNAKGAKADLDYSKKILEDPKGIVAKYKPLKDLIVTLGYNIVVGAVYGAIGTVFGFLTRKYVLDHEAEFLALEPAEEPTETPAEEPAKE